MPSWFITNPHRTRPSYFAIWTISQVFGSIRITLPGAALMRQPGPCRHQCEQSQGAHQRARGHDHLLRWAAICEARARSEEKIRTLSSLSERNWKP